jgi:hypothetical protein
MSEWDSLLYNAAKWLQSQWEKEIGVTVWTSENQLYQLLKRQLKGMLVQQHAQPTWISPQHLDIYIPEASTVVEYMGRQHYEPIDFFGGKQGLSITQERDKKKRQKCETHNIELHVVKYNEDIGMRAQTIITYIKNKQEKP